jgi:hypothetical protein
LWIRRRIDREVALPARSQNEVEPPLEIFSCPHGQVEAGRPSNLAETSELVSLFNCKD